MACEKCWNDALWRARGDGRSPADHYFELLQERKNRPCGPEYESENYKRCTAIASAKGIIAEMEANDAKRA